MSGYRLLNNNETDSQGILRAIDKANEPHKEQRLNYNWPVWFSKESGKRFSDSKCFKGRMINISSMGAVFRCGEEGNSLHVGQQINAQFRVPRFGWFEPFSVLLTTQSGCICHVRNTKNLCRQIEIKFNDPLFFKPGEQGLTEFEAQKKLAKAAANGGAKFRLLGG